MRLVRLKDAVTGEATLQRHTHHVEHRDEQQRDGDEHLLLSTILGSHRAHQTLYAHVGTHITEEKAACIAHEYLHSSHFAKDIEAPEDHQRADDGCIERGNWLTLDEQHCVGRQDEYAQPGRQTIDAVDEIDGVYDDKYYPHRQQITCPERNVVQTKDAIEVADDKIAQRKDEGSNRLNDELVGRFHAIAVVDVSYQIYQQCAARHGNRRHAEHVFLASAKHAHLRSHKESHHGGRHEYHSAKAWHGNAMHLALVGKVEILETQTGLDDDRQSNGRDNHCRDKGCNKW